MTTSSDKPGHATGQSTSPPPKWKWTVPVRHPNLYLWLLFVAVLDVIFTRVVLFFGGKEINPVADFVIDNWGRFGMALFKMAITAFVIVVCEFIATRSIRISRRLALASILISAVPVVWSCIIIITLILNPPVEKDGEFEEEGYEVRILQPIQQELELERRRDHG